MGLRSRRKGYRVEHELEQELRADGLTARRVPLSGGAAGWPGDLIVENEICEVKARATGFRLLTRWLEAARYLILKADREEALIVMRKADWVRLLKEGKPGAGQVA